MIFFYFFEKYKRIKINSFWYLSMPMLRDVIWERGLRESVIADEKKRRTENQSAKQMHNALDSKLTGWTNWFYSRITINIHKNTVLQTVLHRNMNNQKCSIISRMITKWKLWVSVFFLLLLSPTTIARWRRWWQRR